VKETKTPPLARLAAEAVALWRLDAELVDKPLPARVLRARRRRIEWLRYAVQAVALAIVAWIGWTFVAWVRGIEAGVASGTRPPGVEAFLPIAALMSLRHLVQTGQVHPVHPAGLVILLAVLATSLLLKKAFCSWICPIGTLSDALARVSRAAFGRYVVLPRWADLPLRSLKYLLLLFFARAIFVQMSGAEVAAFLDAPYSRVADVKMLYFFERLSPFALGTLAGLVFLSMLIPLFWCRYLCPYGALLGAVSLLAPLKVTRHAASCIDCGLCAKACPSRLPVDRLGRVRSDECFACLSCVAACPVPRALRVEAPAPWRLAVRPAAFAVLLVTLFWGGIEAARAAGVWRSAVSDAELARRVREIDDPRYSHLQGQAPRD
jgi:polyferredoxin